MGLLYWIKFGVVVLLAAALLGLGWTVKYQYGKIQELNTQVSVAKIENKNLQSTLTKQNKSIIESNAKHEEVQKQLDKASIVNKEIRTEFRKFRNVLNQRPIPESCEEAKKEMIEIGREIGKKWKN